MTNQELLALNLAVTEADELRAQNAELVQTLKWALSHIGEGTPYYETETGMPGLAADMFMQNVSAASNLIAKAEGSK